MKIGLDLAEILRISKLDWCDGGGEGEKKERRRRGGILLSNGFVLIKSATMWICNVSIYNLNYYMR